MLRNLKVVSQMVVKCDFYHIHITFLFCWVQLHDGSGFHWKCSCIILSLRRRDVLQQLCLFGSMSPSAFIDSDETFLN